MKFCEAMELLKAGKKVTRQTWKDSLHFLMDGSDVKSYQPKLTNYIYNEDIMISDGWVVEGQDGEHRFCDIVGWLQQGFKARLKDWKEPFIYLDKQTNSLVLYCMEVMPFIPDFDSFVAQDWIEI